MIAPYDEMAFAVGIAPHRWVHAHSFRRFVQAPRRSGTPVKIYGQFGAASAGTRENQPPQSLPIHEDRISRLPQMSACVRTGLDSCFDSDALVHHRTGAIDGCFFPRGTMTVVPAISRRIFCPKKNAIARDALGALASRASCVLHPLRMRQSASVNAY